MESKKLIVKLIICFFITTLVFADNWPQWRGANRDGISSEKNLLKEWPEDGPKLIWAYEDLGAGFSSVAVSKGVIFTTGEVDEKEAVFALDIDGKLLWKTVYGPRWEDSFQAMRSTPTVDSNYIYVVSGTGKLVCLERTTGKIVWSVNAVEDFSAEYHRWGIAESPLVVDDKVICTPGAEEASLVAYDKLTGKLLWQTKELSDEANYCSPILVERAGKKIIATMLSEHFVGIDASTGKTLWQDAFEDYFDDPKDINPVSPLYHNGSFYTTSGYDDGGALYDLSDDGLSITRRWTDKTLDIHIGGAVLVDGYIYGANWINNSKGNWVCLEWETGKVMYEKKWINKGSVISAEGMLYCFTEKKGEVGLVKASPKKFTLVSHFKLPLGSGQRWAHPAISDGRLYLRRGEALMVYDIKLP